MFFKISLIFSILLIYSVNNQLLTAENDSSGELQSNQSANVILEGLDDVEKIESPLILESEVHGQLHLSPIDPEHHLYPVKIISIDDWLMPAEDYGKPIFLAEGEHKIKLIPDFSNIEPKKIFMNSLWLEKYIAFTVSKGQNIALAARLMDNHKLEWKVELYLVEPSENDPHDMDLTTNNFRNTVNE